MYMLVLDLLLFQAPEITSRRSTPTSVLSAWENCPTPARGPTFLLCEPESITVSQFMQSSARPYAQRKIMTGQSPPKLHSPRSKHKAQSRARDVATDLQPPCDRTSDEKHPRTSFFLPAPLRADTLMRARMHSEDNSIANQPFPRTASYDIFELRGKTSNCSSSEAILDPFALLRLRRPVVFAGIYLIERVG
jgi:hypothetical protein